MNSDTFSNHKLRAMSFDHFLPYSFLKKDTKFGKVKKNQKRNKKNELHNELHFVYYTLKYPIAV